MSAVLPVSGPHTRTTDSVPQIMLMVVAALLPATLYGFILFGWPAINLFAVTVLTCVLCEALSLWLAGKPVRLFLMDGSVLLTAWLLAMSLPPWAPWWIGAVGGFFAVVIGKQVFGGIGQNVFNPAMLARVALLVSFPLEMTFWVEPQPLFSGAAPGFFESLTITFAGLVDLDGMSGASLMGHVRTELGQDHSLGEAMAGAPGMLSAGLGHVPGSLGETSALLILGGGIYLLRRRIITWPAPVAMLSAVAILATIFHFIEPQRYPDAMFHLVSGSLMLGAFFIVTDPVTSPATFRGQLIFGAGCGALVYVIRTWGGYPEGVAFAIVLMNGFTPVIDHYLRPRIYGRTRSGKPQPPKSQNLQ